MRRGRFQGSSAPRGRKGSFRGWHRFVPLSLPLPKKILCRPYRALVFLRGDTRPFRTGLNSVAPTALEALHAAILREAAREFVGSVPLDTLFSFVRAGGTRRRYKSAQPQSIHRRFEGRRLPVRDLHPRQPGAKSPPRVAALQNRAPANHAAAEAVWRAVARRRMQASDSRKKIGRGSSTACPGAARKAKSPGHSAQNDCSQVGGKSEPEAPD
jgi:hypothetical protein